MAPKHPEPSRKQPKADPADLAARIRAGGNVLENLERWAHDAGKED